MAVGLAAEPSAFGAAADAPDAAGRSPLEAHVGVAKRLGRGTVVPG
jgi:hypothetical protein